MRRTLAELPIEILGLADMDGNAPPVPEDGRTPLENARQKAHAYFENLPQELQPGIHVRTVGGKYQRNVETCSALSGRNPSKIGITPSFSSRSRISRLRIVQPTSWTP